MLIDFKAFKDPHLCHIEKDIHLKQCDIVHYIQIVFTWNFSTDWTTNIIIFQFQSTTRKIQSGTYCFHFTPTKNIKSHQRDIYNHTSPWFICRFKPSKLCATLLISSHLYQNLYFANWDKVYKKQKKKMHTLSQKK